ncbi:MAG: hypothetical protein QG582_686 [Candidatus Thermoplasmatota archaeon]|nr:hypothetical protein [Candidatus Thermoplasmatota archaeon]
MGGDYTRAKRLIVGAVAMFMLSLTAVQATAEYSLEESVIYAQGIGFDGFEVVPSAAEPATIVGPASNVMVDWSDDIVFHQFPAGQKVRTEVVLHNVNADGTMGPAVYTITAHLLIAPVNADGKLGTAIYQSCIADGLWVDGPSEAYSAEVNELGLLLYGFNWDTRGVDAGTYRLVFWLEKDASCPDVNPYSGLPIVYYPVDMTQGAPGDTDASAGTIYGIVGYDFAKELSWLDITLLEKKSGRK